MTAQIVDRAISAVRRDGRRANEWLWRLVIDHGYVFRDVKSLIDAAHDDWRKDQSKGRVA